MTHRRRVLTQVAAASVIGLVTGVVVLALEHLVDDVLREIFEAPVWVPAVTVVAGTAVAAVLVQTLGGRSPATTEVCVEEFHEDQPTLEPRHAPGRLAAAFATLAGGAPLGMEGPAVYTGAAVATVLRCRFPTLAALGRGHRSAVRRRNKHRGAGVVRDRGCSVDARCRLRRAAHCGRLHG
jgi:H+/Cl- antiporter ClcA